MKKPIKNKCVKVRGIITGISSQLFAQQEFDCLITTDETGKTLSISDGMVQFTIPFEPIERFLK